MPKTMYDVGLDRSPANFTPLSPLGFVERSATVFPDLPGGHSWQRCDADPPNVA